MRAVSLLLPLLPFAAAACDFRYAPPVDGTSYAVTCLSGPCELSTCSDALDITLATGGTRVGVSADRLCSSGGQLAAMAGTKPVGRASERGVVFAYAPPVGNADVTCSVTAYEKGAEVSGVTVAPHETVALTFPRMPAEAITFVASAPVSITCSVDQRDVPALPPGDFHVALIPVTKSSLFGALSRKLRVISVDCETGALITGADITCTVRNEDGTVAPCPGAALGAGAGISEWSVRANFNYRALPFRVDGAECMAGMVSSDGAGADAIAAYPVERFARNFALPLAVRGIAFVSDAPFKCAVGARTFEAPRHPSGLFMASYDAHNFEDKRTFPGADIIPGGTMVSCDTAVMAVANVDQGLAEHAGDEYNVHGVEDDALWECEDPPPSTPPTAAPTRTDSPAAAPNTAAITTAAITTAAPNTAAPNTAAITDSPTRAGSPTADTAAVFGRVASTRLGTGAIAGIVICTVVMAGTVVWATSPGWLPYLRKFAREQTPPQDIAHARV